MNENEIKRRFEILSHSPILGRIIYKTGWALEDISSFIKNTVDDVKWNSAHSDTITEKEILNEKNKKTIEMNRRENKKWFITESMDKIAELHYENQSVGSHIYEGWILNIWTQIDLYNKESNSLGEGIDDYVKKYLGDHNEIDTSERPDLVSQWIKTIEVFKTKSNSGKISKNTVSKNIEKFLYSKNLKKMESYEFLMIKLSGFFERYEISDEQIFTALEVD